MPQPPKRDARAKPECDRLFLPDFCGVRMVFAVVIIAELFALVLTLAPGTGAADRWGRLSLISLFVQWVALSSAAVLCLARRWLCRLDNTWAATASYVLLLLTTAFMSEAAWQIERHPALGTNMIGAGHAEFLLRNLALCAILSALVLRYLYVQHQWKRNLEAEALARVQALQARIRPHFLFNSMNTIAALTRSRPELAEAAVEDLADLFRVTLNDGRSRLTLAEELELARRYLHIEKLRLGERLHVEWDLEGLPDDAGLPALTLQPLLENAIYHGIETLTGGGSIRIRGRCDGDRVVFDISNPVPAEGSRQRAGNRIAQDNIRQRLEHAFGERGGMTVTEQDRHYHVHLWFPREPGEARA